MPGRVTSIVSAASRRIQRSVGQFLAAPADLLIDLAAHLVGQRADQRPLLGRELAHLLEDRGDLALLTQKADPQLLQRGFAVCLCKQLGRRLADVLQCLFHLVFHLN